MQQKALHQETSNQQVNSDWSMVTTKKPLIIQTIHQVNSIALSPDGKFIASAGGDDNGDYSIKIWDPITGQQFGNGMHGHTHQIKSINYSKCGNYIVSGGQDKTIRQWDVYSQQQIGQSIIVESEVSAVYYSPDQRFIVSVQIEEINVWDPLTGQEYIDKRKQIPRILKPYSWDGEELIVCTYQARISSISPIHYRLVLGGDTGKLLIWDYEKCQYFGEPLNGPIGYLYSLEYSRDGKLIVSGCNFNLVTLWDAISRQKILQIKNHTSTYIDAVCISPDMKYIISGTANALQLWNRQTGKKISDLKLGWQLKSLLYSIDGKYIITRCEDAKISIMIAPIQDKPGHK